MTKNKQNPLLSKKFLIILNVLFIIVITILLILMNNLKSNKIAIKEILRDKNKNYKFTSPILDCENVEQSEKSLLSHNDIFSKIESLKKKNGVKNVSLYFRDLNNGPWIGIGEKDIFSPASLLKIPILISLFKYAETNPEILKKEIEVMDFDLMNDYTPNMVANDLLKKGNKYTIEQVAESMIKKSDNTGVGIILRNIPEKYVDDVFYSVGVPYKDTHSEVDIQVRDYAGFFRILFNASYLNRDMSEKALDMISQSEYKEGIVAGVPPTVTVSHKFGERSYENIRQLHDCGIVYYPNKPYILCIMTKGDDFKDQQNVIKELSNYIYNKIDSKK